MVDVNSSDSDLNFDVFVSYSHKNVDQLAGVLTFLEKRGYRVYWDKRLTAGKDWQDSLRQRIKSAKKVLALWSADAALSEVVAWEMSIADGDSKLVPLWLDDTPPKVVFRKLHHLKVTDFEAEASDIIAALGIEPSNKPKPAAPARLTEDEIYLEGLPTGADKLFGRDIELSTLLKSWDSGGQSNPAVKTNAVVLHAIGGAGKSALLRSFLDALAAKGYPGAEKVYGWSAYSQGSGDNRNADADGFINRALRFFGYDIDAKPITDPVERGRLLAKLIRKQRTLLVLDGLEPLQDLPHVNEGRLKDRGLQALITSLAKENPGLLVITSRQELPELAAIGPPKVINHALDQLSDHAGAELLKHLGVHGREKELMAAVHEVGGHALSVSLLGTYLSAVCSGDVARRDTLRLNEIIDDAAEALGDRRAKRAQRIMDAYVERFAALEKSQSAGEGDPERMILSLVGLFDRPAEAEALAAVLAEPPIPGLTEGWHKLSQQSRDLRWTYAVKRLRALKLLSNADANNPGGLDAHPVVRQHFGQKLKEDEPGAYREANRRLYHHYRSVDLPEPFRTPEAIGLLQLAGTIKAADAFERTISALSDGSFPDDLRDRLPEGLRTVAPDEFRSLFDSFDNETFAKAQAAYLPETLETMQPLFAAVAHGCAAGLYQEVYEETYWVRVMRCDDYYAWHKLGAYNAGFGALATFFVTPWSLPQPSLTDSNQAVVLNQAGYALRALGRLHEAIEPIRVGAQLQASMEDWQNAASGHANLSELLLTLGDVSAAVAVGHDAVKYADKSDDPHERCARRTGLADALFQAGEKGAADSLLREAERMQAEISPSFPQLFSRGGYQLCNQLLDQGRIAEVAERAKRSLTLAQGSKYLLDIALDTLTLGRAAHLARLRVAEEGTHSAHLLVAPEMSDTARANLDAAVEGFRKAGQEDDLPRGLLARAAFRRDTRDFDGAQEDLAEVHEIASRGGMRLFLTDYYLEMGRLGFACDPALSCPDSRRNIEACVRYAHDLIQATGYHRRDGELAALRDALDRAALS